MTDALAGSRFCRCLGLPLLQVNLYANANNLFPRLSKERALLSLEKAARWSVVHGKWWRGREQSHQFMAGRGCGIFPRSDIAVEGKIEV